MTTENTTDKAAIKPINFALLPKWENPKQQMVIGTETLNGTKVLENPVYWVQKHPIEVGEKMFGLSKKQIERVQEMDAVAWKKGQING